MALRARRVDLAEALLPEPSTHWQQRKIVDDRLVVARAGADFRALQVAGDLAAVRLDRALHGGDRGRLLAERHLTGDGLDVGVGERHLHDEPIHELVEQLDVVERLLSGRHEQHAAVELFGEGLGQFGEDGGAIVGIADVLLGLVEQDDRAGELLGVVRVLGGVTQEHVLGQADELGRGEVAALLLELLLERRPDVGLAGGEVLVPCQDRFADAGAHPEVGKLLLPGATVGFDVLLHLVEGALPLEPEDEPGDWVLLRQAGGAEDHAEDRLADAVVGAGQERAGGGEQTTVAAAGVVEFGEVGPDLLGHLRHDSAGRRTVGEGRVGP